MPTGILREEDQQARKRHATRGSVKQKTKKKRQQRAQSRLALARFRQQQREQRQQMAAHRAQQQWNKTLRHLTDLGATVKQHEKRETTRRRRSMRSPLRARPFTFARALRCSAGSN